MQQHEGNCFVDRCRNTFHMLHMYMLGDIKVQNLWGVEPTGILLGGVLGVGT